MKRRGTTFSNILYETKYFIFFIIALLILALLFTVLLPLNQIQADPRSDTRAFVTKFYNKFLDRNPDSLGLEAWTNDLISGNKSGSDMAFGFAFSAEFIIKNVSNEEYVKIMHEVFFNREPDNSEYDHWIGALGSGSSRYSILADFLNSEEFKNLCEVYNINPGSLPKDEPFFVSNAPKLTIHFIDVGQGESTLIQSPSGTTVLIDGAGDEGADKVTSYIKSLGIKRINIIVATHPHPDHISGLINVLNNFNVDKVIDLGVPHANEFYWGYMKAISKSDANYVNWSAGSEFDLGSNTKMRIVGPFNFPTKKLNESSIVIKLTYHNISFLFAGDAEHMLEGEIVASGQDISADVLKVGHHGSISSSSMTFLKNINPSIAVISLGLNNEYDFPHSIVMQKFNSLGVNVYRTDISKDVIMYSDGNVIKVIN